MQPEKTHTVYEGDLFDVVVEEWEGREREIVQHPGATAIVAIDGDDCVTLVRQRREDAELVSAARRLARPVWRGAAENAAADGRAADGSAAHGSAADGRAADGRAADGRAADGRLG